MAGKRVHGVFAGVCLIIIILFVLTASSPASSTDTDVSKKDKQAETKKVKAADTKKDKTAGAKKEDSAETEDSEEDDLDEGDIIYRKVKSPIEDKFDKNSDHYLDGVEMIEMHKY